MSHTLVSTHVSLLMCIHMHIHTYTHCLGTGTHFICISYSQGIRKMSEKKLRFRKMEEFMMFVNGHGFAPSIQNFLPGPPYE